MVVFDRAPQSLRADILAYAELDARTRAITKAKWAAETARRARPHPAHAIVG